jgi:DNA-binding NtrC family response regulator
VSDKLNKPLLPTPIDTNLPYREAKQQFRKVFLTALIQRHLGNISEVADIAGVKRETVHRLIKQLKIEVDSLRSHPAKTYERDTLVQDVVEKSIRKYEPALNPAKVRMLYDNVPDISRQLVKELPEEWDLEHAEAEWEKVFFAKTLNEHDHNVSRTARALKIRYETLHRKLKALGM